MSKTQLPYSGVGQQAPKLNMQGFESKAPFFSSSTNVSGGQTETVPRHVLEALLREAISQHPHMVAHLMGQQPTTGAPIPSVGVTSDSKKEPSQQPFKFNLSSEYRAELDPYLLPENKARALEKKKSFNVLKDEDQLDSWCKEYDKWKLGLRTEFGGYKPQPAKKRMSDKNVRFLVEMAARLMGERGRGLVSLDLLIHPQMITSLHQVVRDRKCKGGRADQVFRELREVASFVIQRAHGSLSKEEKARFRLDEVPEWQLIKNALRDAEVRRKSDDTQRLNKDESELIKEGKMPSTEEMNTLEIKLLAFLQSRRTPSEKEKKLAFDFQKHMITLMVSGLIGPAPRHHILINLRIDKGLIFDELKQQYAVDEATGKTKRPTYFYLRQDVTPFITRWLREYRPMLVADLERDHGFVLVKMDGTRRNEIRDAVRSIQKQYLGRTFTVYGFRARQVTDERNEPIEIQKARCDMRQHKLSTAQLIYLKKNRKRTAEMVDKYMEDRKRQGARAVASEAATQPSEEPPLKKARTDQPQPGSTSVSDSGSKVADATQEPDG